MKNVNMTINSNSMQGTSPLAQQSAMPTLVPVYSVAFNIQFESNDDALTFAKIMLQHIQDFDTGAID